MQIGRLETAYYNIFLLFGFAHQIHVDHLQNVIYVCFGKFFANNSLGVRTWSRRSSLTRTGWFGRFHVNNIFTKRCGWMVERRQCIRDWNGDLYVSFKVETSPCSVWLCAFSLVTSPLRYVHAISSLRMVVLNEVLHCEHCQPMRWRRSFRTPSSYIVVELNLRSDSVNSAVTRTISADRHDCEGIDWKVTILNIAICNSALIAIGWALKEYVHRATKSSNRQAWRSNSVKVSSLWVFSSHKRISISLQLLQLNEWRSSFLEI